VRCPFSQLHMQSWIHTGGWLTDSMLILPSDHCQEESAQTPLGKLLLHLHQDGAISKSRCGFMVHLWARETQGHLEAPCYLIHSPSLYRQACTHHRLAAAPASPEPCADSIPMHRSGSIVTCNLWPEQLPFHPLPVII
jgi:hypothetical protein